MRTTIKKMLWGTMLLVIAMACSERKNSGNGNTEQVSISDVSGNYVTEDYGDRNEGYDWAAVKVNQLTDSVIQVSVRSRADLKKPSCTFDAKAYKSNQANLFNAVVEGFSVYFAFSPDSLVISGETDEDNQMLGYFCSGGATLAGVYRKLPEPLDATQLDKVAFRKNLNYGDYFFLVELYGDTLSILPTGLDIDNTVTGQKVEGSVVNAETGDLNNDGFPEILVYLQSDGSGSYGSVVGYSVNNGKSMSQIFFPDIAGNAEAKEGYMGHDEFAIVENTFNQRFPIYKPGDSNASPSGGMRQIQYKLTDGEAMRRFVVEKIVEY